MSFCGTPRLQKRMTLYGFASTCHAMVSQLLHLKYKGIDKTAAGDQYRLFQLTNDERAHLSKFARNLRFFKEEHTTDREAYWKAYSELEYATYELYEIFEHVSTEDVMKAAAVLDRAANEEQLTEEEVKETKAFLNRLAHNANSLIDDGGCF